MSKPGWRLALLLWAAASMLLVAADAPQLLRTVVVSPFALCGVGLAMLTQLPEVRGFAAVALSAVGGLSALVLLSEAIVYVGLWDRLGAFGVIAGQAVIVVLLTTPYRPPRKPGVGPSRGVRDE